MLKELELTNDTPPEPSSHIVLTFTSATSSPVTTCSGLNVSQTSLFHKYTKRERLRELP
jgi:hypothetical protein